MPFAYMPAPLRTGYPWLDALLDQLRQPEAPTMGMSMAKVNVPIQLPLGKGLYRNFLQKQLDAELANLPVDQMTNPAPIENRLNSMGTMGSSFPTWLQRPKDMTAEMTLAANRSRWGDKLGKFTPTGKDEIPPRKQLYQQLMDALSFQGSN